MPNPVNKAAKAGRGRIAGVPLYVWAIGGVGAVGVVWWAYKRQGATAPVPPPADASSTGIDPTTGVPYADEAAGYSGASDYGTAGFGGGYGGGGTVAVPVPSPITVTVKQAAAASNLTWLHRGERAANHVGYTYAATMAALTAYLVGAPLTEHQIAIVEHVASRIGPPPDGAPPIHRLPTQHTQPKHKHKSTAPKQPEVMHVPPTA